MEGATFRLWKPDEESRAQGEREIESARQLCGKLGVPHHVIDWTQEFQTQVVDYFVGEYQKGPHPQPLRHLQPHHQIFRLLELGQGAGV